MPEKLYLVCGGCGEAFDQIDIAAGHDCDITPLGDETFFVIQPESEAF